MLRVFLAFSAFVALSVTALSQLEPPANPPLVFQGATIHTAEGPPIFDGVLIIDKGKIQAVGDAKTPIPAGAKIIDARGKLIIPGLVDSHSHIGIFSRPGVTANVDGNEGSGPVQSALRAIDAVNPDDPGIRMAVAGGVTCANIMPGSGNVIGGATVYVKLRGNSIEEMIVEAQGVLGGLKMANGENPKTFNFGKNKTPPATRMKLAALQRGEFVKAKEYKRKWDAYRKDKTGAPPERDLAMEPLVEVLERKRTVHFHCHRADDLLSAVRLAKEFDFEIVLQHATEGYRVTKELVERKVPVSLTLLDSSGGKFETMGLIEENAAILTKAGVKVAINTDDPITESRFYLRTGAIALRGGLNEDEALKCLTIHPASMMHLDHRLGSLAKGKDADFAILSGAPFSVYTQVLQTWIDGKLVFDAARGAERSYQVGGFALESKVRPMNLPLAKPLPSTKAPTLPEGTKRPKDNETYAVAAGRIHTGTGETIVDGVILVEKGKISFVGPRAKANLPKDVPMLSAAVVTPGLIDAACCVGLSGGANTPADQDQDEKSDPNQADLRVLDGFNPDEGLVEFVRREGVTLMHVLPGRQNVIAGQSAIFKTVGISAERMALKTTAALLINLGEAPKAAYPNKAPTTRMATAAIIRSAFAKALGKDVGSGDGKQQAMALALNRKIPVIFAAHRADDIRTALRLAEEFKLDARLHLATEGYLADDAIAKAKIGVTVHPTMQRVGSSIETMNSHVQTAALLAEKAIPLAICTDLEAYVPKTRVLRHEAAIAAVNGLGQEAAIRAITLDAAKLLGVDKTHGSIEKGKVADLVLYNGDCFEHATHVQMTIIEGRIVYDRAEYLALPFARRALPLSSGGVGCCLGVW
jgi:imidazolonepropionase-like amidohydrolase